MRGIIADLVEDVRTAGPAALAPVEAEVVTLVVLVREIVLGHCRFFLGLLAN